MIAADTIGRHGRIRYREHVLSVITRFGTNRTNPWLESNLSHVAMLCQLTKNDSDEEVTIITARKLLKRGTGDLGIQTMKSKKRKQLPKRPEQITNGGIYRQRMVKVLRNIAIVSKYYLPIPSQKGGAKKCPEDV